MELSECKRAIVEQTPVVWRGGDYTVRSVKLWLNQTERRWEYSAELIDARARRCVVWAALGEVASYSGGADGKLREV